MRLWYLLILLLIGLETIAQEVWIENGSVKGDIYIVDCMADKSDMEIRYHVELQFLVGDNPRLVIPENVAGKRTWLKPGERVKLSWNFGKELREKIDPATIQPILIYSTEVFEGSSLKPIHTLVPAKGHQLIDNASSSHTILTYGSYALAGGAALSLVLAQGQHEKYWDAMDAIEDNIEDNIYENVDIDYEAAREHFKKAETRQSIAIGAASMAVIFWTIDWLSLKRANKKLLQPLIKFDESISYEPILYFYQNRTNTIPGVELGVRIQF